MISVNYLNQNVNYVDYRLALNPDIKVQNSFRIIIDIKLSDIFQFTFIKRRIEYLYGNCLFGFTLGNFTCPDPSQVCPRLIFAIDENFNDFYTFSKTIDNRFDNVSNRNIQNFKNFIIDGLNSTKFLLYIDLQFPNKIASLMTVYEYPNFNEIYDVCTEFSYRSRGFTSDILKYYRTIYPKATWLGVEIKDMYTSPQDLERAVNKWIKENNYKGRNLRMKFLRSQNRANEISQDDLKLEEQNLVKLFLLENKYWKVLAELYIKNGFTNILISNKTYSGKDGPAPWFLSLLLNPSELVNNDPTEININEAMLELDRINNFNFVFKPQVKYFFDGLYNNMKDEEAGASFFIENITWKNEYEIYHILNAQHEFFVGFEDDNSFQTRFNSSKFDWHLHPESAYAFYSTLYGFPSIGDMNTSSYRVKFTNMFSTVISREGLYFYKITPPLQNLLLLLNNDAKVNYFATKIKNAYKDPKFEDAYKNPGIDPSIVIQQYLSINNAITFNNIVSSAELAAFVSVPNPEYTFTPRESKLINLLQALNCKVFDIVFVHNFQNVNQTIIDIVNRSISLQDKTPEFNNLMNFLKPQLYDEVWILKFWQTIISTPDYQIKRDVTDYLKNNPVYTPYIINNFISYGPVDSKLSAIL